MCCPPTTLISNFQIVGDNCTALTGDSNFVTVETYHLSYTGRPNTVALRRVSNDRDITSYVLQRPHRCSYAIRVNSYNRLCVLGYCGVDSSRTKATITAAADEHRDSFGVDNSGGYGGKG
jgi:hypothetical protein